MDWIGATTFAADEKANKIIEAANKEMEAIEKRYANEIKVAAAAGKDVTDLEIKKNEEIKAEATKGIVALNQLYANQGGKWLEGQKEQYEEYLQTVRDTNSEIESLENARQKEKQDKQDAADKLAAQKRKEAMLREMGDAIKLNIFLNQIERDRQNDIAENAQLEIDARIEASYKAQAAAEKIAFDQRKEALSAENISASGIILIQAKYENEITKIKKDGAEQRTDITNDFYKTQKALAEKALAEQKETIQKEAELIQQGFTDQENIIKQELIDGFITREQAEQKLDAMYRKHLNERIDAQIEALEKEALLFAENSKEREEIEKKIADARQQRLDNNFKDAAGKAKAFLGKGAQDVGEGINDWIAKWKQAIFENLDAIGGIVSEMTQRTLANWMRNRRHNRKKRINF